jgi:uncharacterized protein
MTAPLDHPEEASPTLAGLHWRVGSDTRVAIASYLLVVAALWLAFQVFTTDRVAANFITFGPVTLLGLGIIVPLAYTTTVRRRPISDLGLTTSALVPSLALGLLLGFDTFYNTLRMVDIEWAAPLVPLVAMTLLVGLFESVFFRGWLQLRFEAAFGVVPGLVLAAVLYSLYHAGYGMTISEMVPLFGYGLVFGAAFRLTRSVFVLWPFYTPVGSLYANLSDGLALPFEATYGFVLVLGAAFVAVLLATRWTRRARSRHPGGALKHA